MKQGFSRHYEIERDADGLPLRMFWLGDYPIRPNVVHVTCPRCQSGRWQSGACLDCWYRAPLTWDEYKHDAVMQRLHAERA